MKQKTVINISLTVKFSWLVNLTKCLFLMELQLKQLSLK